MPEESDFTGPTEERDAVVAAEAIAEYVAHHAEPAREDPAVCGLCGYVGRSADEDEVCPACHDGETDAWELLREARRGVHPLGGALYDMRCRLEEAQKAARLFGEALRLISAGERPIYRWRPGEDDGWAGYTTDPEELPGNAVCERWDVDAGEWRPFSSALDYLHREG